MSPSALRTIRASAIVVLRFSCCVQTAATKWFVVLIRPHDLERGGKSEADRPVPNLNLDPIFSQFQPVAHIVCDGHGLVDEATFLGGFNQSDQIFE